MSKVQYHLIMLVLPSTSFFKKKHEKFANERFRKKNCLKVQDELLRIGLS